METSKIGVNAFLSTLHHTQREIITTALQSRAAILQIPIGLESHLITLDLGVPGEDRCAVDERTGQACTAVRAVTREPNQEPPGSITRPMAASLGGTSSRRSQPYPSIKD